MSDSSNDCDGDQIQNALVETILTSDHAVSARDLQIAALGRDFSNYTSDANFCIYFKLVHDRKEAEEDIKDGTFLPDFVHQFFIDQERIFGYKKPILRLFYTASRLKRYIKFDYEDKLSKEKDGIEPDDVMKYLEPIIEDSDYTQDFNQFINEVESKEEQEFRPPGNLLFEFSCQFKKKVLLSRAQREQLEMAGGSQSNGVNGNKQQHLNGNAPTSSSSAAATNGHSNGNCLKSLDSAGDQDGQALMKKYQIFHANAETSNFKNFQARMQTLIMWFIESATMIDYEDPRWDFFLIFEKFNPSTINDSEAPSISTEDRYYFAGYATVYRYYAYPDKMRPRVSQMLLLPPYRRNHLGTTLLQSIYDYYKKLPATLDITAEDPDEEFIAMRDYLDCVNCMKLPTFQPDNLKLGWSEKLAKESQEKLRLCQRQTRKIYEILKLRSIDESNEEEIRSYRLEIKNRLNIPHRRLILDCDKVEKKGYELPEEMRQQRDNQKLVAATLEENYQELIKQYKHTIEKLNLPITSQ